MKKREIKPSIKITMNQATKDAYNSEWEKFKENYREVTHESFLKYLLSVNSSKIDKGANRAERLIKEWLSFGFNGVITPQKIRTELDGKAPTIKGENGKIKKLSISFGACNTVCELYHEEIEAHNAKFAKKS